MVRGQRRLRGTNAELERHVAEAVASYEKSQRALVQAQKLEALGRLTGGIAHDFNNVLQTLTAGLQARGWTRRTRCGAAAACERAVARGTELARQLMAFGRVQEVCVRNLRHWGAAAEAQTSCRRRAAGQHRLSLELSGSLAGQGRPAAARAGPAQPGDERPRRHARAAAALQLRAWTERGHRAGARPRPGRWRGGLVERQRRGHEPGGDGARLRSLLHHQGRGPRLRHGAAAGLRLRAPERRHAGAGKPRRRRHHGDAVSAALAEARRTRRRAGPASAAVEQATVSVLLVEDDAEVRETVAAACGGGFEIQPPAAPTRRSRAGTPASDRGGLHRRGDARRVERRRPGAAHRAATSRACGVVIATGYSDRAVHIEGVRALPKPYDAQQAVEALNAAMAGGSD